MGWKVLVSWSALQLQQQQQGCSLGVGGEKKEAAGPKNSIVALLWNTLHVPFAWSGDAWCSRHSSHSDLPSTWLGSGISACTACSK